MLKYKFTKDGGFAVHDTVTGMGAYAYPTSLNSAAAQRDPEGTAKEMMRCEHDYYRGDPKICAKQDARIAAMFDAEQE